MMRDDEGYGIGKDWTTGMGKWVRVQLYEFLKNKRFIRYGRFGRN